MVRSRRALVPCLFAGAVAALSLSTAPAEAEAVATDLHHVVFDSLQPPPVTGSTVEAVVSLVTDSAPVAGQVVRFRVDPLGAPTPRPAGTATTDGTGEATTGLLLRRCSRITARFAGTASYGPSATSWVECVGPHVSMAISDRLPRRGTVVVLSGRTRPVQADRRVRLWTGDRPFLTNNPRRLLARGTTDGSGRYRIAYRFPKPGRLRVFVTVDGSRLYAEGYSASRRLRVTQH